MESTNTTTTGDDNEIFRTASAQDINNNNIQDLAFSPYSFVHASTGQVYTRPSVPSPSSSVCDLCFKSFSSFSLLYKHKAKLCYEDLTGELITPIKICFSESHLIWINDSIKALNMDVVQDKPGSLCVIVDESMVEITMRRFYVSQIAKYNLEEWYPALEQLASTLGNNKGFTPKTVFMTLSDDELKMIRGICSVVLASNIGMNSRETQKELSLRENLEDRITAAVFKTPNTYPNSNYDNTVDFEDTSASFQPEAQRIVFLLKYQTVMKATACCRRCKRRWQP